MKVLKGTKIYEDAKKHGIRYRNVSPYEVICTKYILADEILKLKNVEELVGKYYNEKYFESTLKYILKNMFPESAFKFYEDLSIYWQKNDLYKMSHSRKELYEIVFDYVKYNNKVTDEFICCLRYDYVFNNQYEELPVYLNKGTEDKYKSAKRFMSNNLKFQEKYFGKERDSRKIINEFRIVDIGNNAVLFIYKDKNNIFNRCRTYTINDFLGEIIYEQKR